MPVFQPLLGREQEPGWKLDRFREIEDDNLMSKEEVAEMHASTLNGILNSETYKLFLEKMKEQ